jgi:DNA repair protein RecO (recombination protein O)
VVDFSETSCVVSLFTREFGKIEGLAKGGRRLKGPFESALDLLAVCRIVFIRKSADVLDLLTEAKLERRFRLRPRTLGGLYAAYYVAELLRELTEVYDPHPVLFDVADSTLAALADGTDVGAAVLRFEITLLAQLGHMPATRECVGCGAQVPRTGRVPFAFSAGGVLCGKCRPGRRSVIAVTPAALATIEQVMEHVSETAACSPASQLSRRTSSLVACQARLQATSGSGTPPVSIAPAVRGELRGVLNQYFSAMIGRPMRMHRYLAAR